MMESDRVLDSNNNLHTSSRDDTELRGLGGGEDWETGHSNSPGDVGGGGSGGVTFRIVA